MFQFTLTYNSVDTVVTEPQGFADFETVIKRDFKTHGLVYYFTKGDLKLGFAGEGRSVLLNAFEAEGDDAEVTLTVQRRNESWQTWTTIYTGTAIMSNRSVDIDYFSVDFEQSGVIQDIMNNLDTPIDLGLTKDFKGNTLTPLTPQNIDLYAKTLLLSYQTKIDDGSGLVTYTDTDTDTDTVFTKYLTFNLNDFISGQLPGWRNDAMTQTIVRQTAFDTRLETQANYVNETRGDLTFTSQVKFECNLDVTFLASGNHSAFIKCSLYKDGVSVGDFYSDSDFVLGGTSITINTGVITMNADIVQSNLTVAAANKYAIVFEFNGTAASSTDITLDIDLDIYDSSQFNLSMLVDAPASNCDTYSILTILRRTIQIMTGVPDAAESDYFGLTNDGNLSDGCGGINFITNGYRIRGIDREPVIVLRDFLNSLQAMFCCGWSLESIYGSYVLRVEPFEYFYNDHEMFELSSVVNYKETAFDDMLFNDIEIGYAKIADDEENANTLDDFNTITNYSTPLKKVKNKYSQISDIIASPYLIEITRRVQFNQGDDLSTRYDDDLFIINTFRTSPTTFTPVSDENWDSISGLIDETTTYNLALNPLYMLFQHSVLVNTISKGKLGSENYQNTFFKNNGDVVLELKPSFTCLSGLIPTYPLTLNQSVAISTLNAGAKIFEPTKIECEVVLSDAQLSGIKDAIEGVDSGVYSQYGYISLPDNEGNIVSGWILDMPYNISNGIVTFTLLKRSIYGS